MLRRLDATLGAQQGRLFCWAPVCLAAGIGFYFGLPREPSTWQWGASAALFALLLLGGLRAHVLRPLAFGAALIVAGLLLAGHRTHWVAEPRLDWRYYGPIEGRIVLVDRSASGRPRLTLDRVVLSRVAPHHVPARIRISLHGASGDLDPRPGMTIITTGHLGPASGPSEPGGFDFRRHAWFARLGAIGYTRAPALLLSPARGGTELLVARLRDRISRGVRAALPGETGAFAAAITTGDRSVMSAQTLAALRSSNLAHLLAISGLHMGLLTGTVFWALRLCLALVPTLALGAPIKKYAAIGALAAGAGYLALSGGNVATQRAFIMVAVVFGAVLGDRRAITLRAVAAAAMIVLILRPEALTGPGFQMSFAATTALVAIFRALRHSPGPALPRWTAPVIGTLLSSAIAGAATAPYAAAHFNQMSRYGLIANLLSVPLMGALVMPAAVLAAVLAPFGGGWIGLAIMSPAIDWILGVALYVSALEGVLWRIVTPVPAVLPLISLGALWVILWRGRARWAGIAPAMLALMLWLQTERPLLLVSDSGGLLGRLGAEGRALSKPRGEDFTAMSWLENDGDDADRDTAFARPGFTGVPPRRETRIAGRPVRHLTGRGAAAAFEAACADGGLVILSVPAPDVPAEHSCTVLDENDLARLGAAAIRTGPGGWQITGARDAAAHRLWGR
ncbi:ComEC/Rec2 family competence protein [Profundibacterium mesophilum]|nr:ComEC/Rec2 family competence protein [Profundibacterium mesophilum]